MNRRKDRIEFEYKKLKDGRYKVFIDYVSTNGDRDGTTDIISDFKTVQKHKAEAQRQAKRSNYSFSVKRL